MQRVFSIFASSRTALSARHIPARVVLGGPWSYRFSSSLVESLNESRGLHVSQYSRFLDEAEITNRLKEYEGFVELSPVDHKAPKFRFAIFASPEHAQGDKSQPRESTSDTLFFGELSPKVDPADVEALLRQFSGFISFEKREDRGHWFAKFDTAGNAGAAKASIVVKPDFPARPWSVKLAKRKAT
ncbi:hypothetical protein BS47DRAFT_1489313 [Hydnum rufescens UP504]|uniref:RRM domain-containing protein n=1 Tax=Hydnum rufescens UP504 TaxID=1448309 RepID=A0A9P6AIL6_9AGAM|nr:hypothetical protein BS47DRAFT_1489313 [Hydnum rufescens UP504]